VKFCRECCNVVLKEEVEPPPESVPGSPTVSETGSLARGDLGIVNRADPGIVNRADPGIVNRADPGIVNRAHPGILNRADPSSPTTADPGRLQSSPSSLGPPFIYDSPVDSPVDPHDSSPVHKTDQENDVPSVRPVLNWNTWTDAFVNEVLFGEHQSDVDEHVSLSVEKPVVQVGERPTLRSRQTGLSSQMALVSQHECQQEVEKQQKQTGSQQEREQPLLTEREQTGHQESKKEQQQTAQNNQQEIVDQQQQMGLSLQKESEKQTGLSSQQERGQPLLTEGEQTGLSSHQESEKEQTAQNNQQMGLSNQPQQIDFETAKAMASRNLFALPRKVATGSQQAGTHRELQRKQLPDARLTAQAERERQMGEKERERRSEEMWRRLHIQALEKKLEELENELERSVDSEYSWRISNSRSEIFQELKKLQSQQKE